MKGRPKARHACPGMSSGVVDVVTRTVSMSMIRMRIRAGHGAGLLRLVSMRALAVPMAGLIASSLFAMDTSPWCSRRLRSDRAGRRRCSFARSFGGQAATADYQHRIPSSLEVRPTRIALLIISSLRPVGPLSTRRGEDILPERTQPNLHPYSPTLHRRHSPQPRPPLPQLHHLPQCRQAAPRHRHPSAS